MRALSTLAWRQQQARQQSIGSDFLMEICDKTGRDDCLHPPLQRAASAYWGAWRGV